MKDYSKMSVKEIREELDRIMKENEVLRSKGKGDRKGEVLSLLKEGVNDIEKIGKKLGIKEKNVSSILSGLRRDLKEKGEGIISVKYNKKSFVVLMKLEEINRLLSIENFGRMLDKGIEVNE